MVTESAFQQRRENLIRLANSSWVSSVFITICYYMSIDWLNPLYFSILSKPPYIYIRGCCNIKLYQII
jgi:hypothetical protein